MRHLLITTAIIPKEHSFEKLGYSYEQRMLDYNKSFNYALNFKDKFDSMTIIETVSKDKVEELEDSNINVYYSKFSNSFKNKGLNEMFHIHDFLKNSQIKDDDLIIKITGRYLIENINILDINSDFIAKYDGDIYKYDKGVHTFYFGFKKKLFNEFIDFLKSAINKNDNLCIEWLVKDFMISKNIDILKNNYKLGVTTCLYSKEINKWTRVLS